VRGIFAKIDEDQVRPQPRLLCFVRSVGSTCSLLTHSANAERHDFAYRVQGWLWPPSGHMCLLQAILSHCASRPTHAGSVCEYISLILIKSPPFNFSFRALFLRPKCPDFVQLFGADSRQKPNGRPGESVPAVTPCRTHATRATPPSLPLLKAQRKIN
jgi:hypothetical protein